MINPAMDIAELEKYFNENFIARGELGASVSAWKNGEEIISLNDGFTERQKLNRWSTDTLAPVYSATKGPSAATLLHVLGRRGLDAKTPVSEVWSGFPIHDATFGEMLSHQCGLAALEEVVDVFNHPAVAAAIERKRPEWFPGQGHGYHPRTFGFLMDECVRRLEGVSLGDFWNRKIAAPLGLHFWIGLPENQFWRVTKLVPGRTSPAAFEDGFYAAFSQPNSLTRRAFSSPKGLHAVSEMNEPRAWKAALPAMGGVGSASSLAKFYQAAIGAIGSPFSVATLAALGALQSSAEDKVLLRETAFTCGCQQDPLDEDGMKKRNFYGKSLQAFGHPGAGGSHAFGDPESGVSFAYVMNQMELSPMPGERSLGLVRRLGI